MKNYNKLQEYYYHFKNDNAKQIAEALNIGFDKINNRNNQCEYCAKSKMENINFKKCDKINCQSHIEDYLNQDYNPENDIPLIKNEEIVYPKLEFKYYEDTIEKHNITNDEIDELIELQTIMNTQDSLAVANPRYWIIKSVVREWLDSDIDRGIAAIINTEDGIWYNSEDFIQYINDNYDSCKINKDNLDLDDIVSVRDAVIDHLEDNHKDYLAHDRFIVKYYEWEIKTANSAIFLTYEDAINHINQNRHNLPLYTYPYCTHAYRSERLEKLYKIIQETNWEELKRKMEV